MNLIVGAGVGGFSLGVGYWLAGQFGAAILKALGMQDFADLCVRKSGQGLSRLVAAPWFPYLLIQFVGVGAVLLWLHNMSNA